MTTIAEFARALAEEAEKRGLRIVIEPITNPVQKSISEPVKEPEVEVVTKTAAQLEKERVREEKSWITVSEAARMMGVSTSAIYYRIRKGSIPTRSDGYRKTKVSTSILHRISEFKVGMTKPVAVRCLETGMVFESQGAAAKYYGMNSARIRGISSDPSKSCKGLHFCRVNSES